MVPRAVFFAAALFAVSIALVLAVDSGLEQAPGAAAEEGVPPARHPAQPAPGIDYARLAAQAQAAGPAQFTGQANPRGRGDLANGALRELVRAFEEGRAAPSSLRIEGESVRVEVLHSLSSEEIADVVTGLGGEVYGEVPGQLAEALVPVASLESLEAHPGVDYVRPPLRASGPLEQESGPLSGTAVPAGMSFIGEEVFKMNADSWQFAGYSGLGVKVGIIDGFDGPTWDAAQAAGELPEPSGTFCREFGQACDIWGFGVQHGEGVAEVVHEMAPDAQLYLATVYTASDITAAVNYFAANGVDIITRSQTAEYDGPGDGTGPIASAVDGAINQGMMWLNSAGNGAGTDTEPGGYWRGGWNDPDFDGYLNWSGANELLPFVCGFVNGVRWDDWYVAVPTDYDVIVVDDNVQQNIKVTSQNDQTAGAPPLESILDQPYSCNGDQDIDYLVVALFDQGGGVFDDTIEFMTNTAVLDQWSNPYSASGPMSDSENPGMLSVGAIDPALGTIIATYSSWGPNNNNFLKPDVSAPACFESFTYYPNCFNGTSSATPAVAGAAALILSSDVISGAGGPSVAGVTPSSLANYIRNSTVDRGVPGNDFVYGRGEVILDDPPDAPTPFAGEAYNFRWYVNLAEQVEISECDLAMPVPPNNPFLKGICVVFDLDVPVGLHEMSIILIKDGALFEATSFEQHLEPTPNWHKSFHPPGADGYYELGIFVDGVLIGTSAVTVTGAGTVAPTASPSPTPTNTADFSPGPTLTAGPTPTPTEAFGVLRVWGDTDCGGLFNIGDAINVSRRLIDLIVSKTPDCPVLGSIVIVDGIARTWGDMDCSLLFNIGDAINVSRRLVNLPVNKPPECPTMGDIVLVAEA